MNNSIINQKESNIMSKKVNPKRKAYAEKQQKEGQKVVTWIFIGLIILALVYVAFTLSSWS